MQNLHEEFKSRRSKSNSSSGGFFSNLGFTFGAGTINTCTPGDTSFFCRFSRFFNMIIMIIVLLFIAIFIYFIISSKKGLFGGTNRSLKRGGAC